MISRVEMTNWRAYEERAFTFGPGLTFVVGSNGAGKTSILEAIGYALTGEANTVEDRGKLLRRQDQFATVRLEADLGGKAYWIERSQSARKAEGAGIGIRGNKSAIATSHRRVTETIEEASGVSADFLRRIIYMAEGDVFRFLQKPPTQALQDQIRQVLGISQMDEFLASVQAAQKQLDGQAKALGDGLARLELLRPREGESFEERIEALEARRKEAVSRLRSAQDRISRCVAENDSVTRAMPMLDKVRQALGGLRPGPREHEQMPVPALLAAIEGEQEVWKGKAEDLHRARARLEGEMSAVQRLQEAIEPFLGKSDAAACPVCGKPMDAEERRRAVDGFRASVEELARQRVEAETELREAVERQRGLERLALAVRDAHSYLAHSGLGALDLQMPFPALWREASSRTESFGRERTALEAKARDCERELTEIEAERSAFGSAVEWLRRHGYANREDAACHLEAIEARSLTLRAATKAAQNVLALQQNADLKPILGQMASVWEAFAGGSGWQVELDPRAMPVLTDGQGRSFDLSHLSGGEKTALMVMLHTIVAHHFSQARFLMIDEPLEHLDPINRRSLMRFLVDAAHAKLFDQAIVTTFEESLIRRYISDELVQVIHV